jgi:hypothetical protein
VAGAAAAAPGLGAAYRFSAVPHVPTQCSELFALAGATAKGPAWATTSNRVNRSFIRQFLQVDDYKLAAGGWLTVWWPAAD